MLIKTAFLQLEIIDLLQKCCAEDLSGFVAIITESKSCSLFLGCSTTTLCCFFGPRLYDYVSVFCPCLHKNRLIPVGDPPSPRAAHAATAVGTMIVVQV